MECGAASENKTDGDEVDNIRKLGRKQKEKKTHNQKQSITKTRRCEKRITHKKKKNEKERIYTWNYSEQKIMKRTKVNRGHQGRELYYQR